MSKRFGVRKNVFYQRIVKTKSFYNKTPTGLRIQLLIGEEFDKRVSVKRIRGYSFGGMILQA